MYVSSDDVAKVLFIVLGLPALASILLCWTGAVLGDPRKLQRTPNSRVVGFAAGWAASVAAFVLCIAINALLVGAIASPVIGGLAACAASRFFASKKND